MFTFKMNGNVKVEDTAEVSLPATNDPTCSLSYSIKVKDELFCVDLSAPVKHEDCSSQSDYQVKSEAPDAKFDITNNINEIYIKSEPVESEELQIKDEIGQNPADGTTEKSTQREYFYCSVCNNKFTVKGSLRQHMKIHTGEKPFKCSMCDYRSATKGVLSSHLKTHTGEKPFKCGSCDYRCIQRSDMSKHIKTHTGEKPFKCGVCDFRSVTKSALSRHLKIHTGEKPFKCGVCVYRCIRKSDLSKHIKVHAGGDKPFKCSVCDYRCMRKCNLKQHVKIHV